MPIWKNDREQVHTGADFNDKSTEARVAALIAKEEQERANGSQQDLLEKIITRQELMIKLILGRSKEKPKWYRFFWTSVRLYALIFSGIGFMMFIGEESLQTVGFSCFGYAASQDFGGMDQVCRAEYAIVLDWYCGMVNNPLIYAINPILTPSYIQYCRSGIAYLHSIESRIYFKK